MPIDFVEESVRAAPVELFDANSKARPLHLEGEVIPQILARVGDEKSATLSMEQVQAYLDKNVLIFDSSDLKNMFKEADFKNEGVLSVRALSAAISGRYPKRRMTGEWRQLVCMLLELPDLVLSSDIVKQKRSKNGVFNAESIWEMPPPELPQISWNKIKSSTVKSPAFQKPQASSNSSLPSMTLTASGLKTTLPSAEEASINEKLSGSKSTFEASNAFENFSKGVETRSKLGLTTSNVNTLLESMKDQDPDWAWKTSPKSSFKAYSAVLPPTSITLNSSSLTTLRTAVFSTTQRKPMFVNSVRGLTTTEEDLKKTMGSDAMDADFFMPLSRVEPTRPTSRKFDATYQDLGSYSNDRLMPSYWFNEHPSLPESVRTVKTKYPWGEWGVETKAVTSPQSRRESRSNGGDRVEAQQGSPTVTSPQQSLSSRPQTAAGPEPQLLTSGSEI